MPGVEPVQVVAAGIPEVLVIEPRIHRDERGFGYESYNALDLAPHIGEQVFLQANFSRSRKHVLRGLHYQLREPQGKLVRVTHGEIFQVAVDLRRSSPTFARVATLRISAEPVRVVWIPPGFAHGFLVLSDGADVEYQLTAPRVADDERCIAWNDPDLAIAWPLAGAPILSRRDANGARLANAEVYE